MAGVGHLYITAHGEFTQAWDGETAQIGLRYLARPLGAPAGPIVAVPDLGPVTPVYNTYSSPNFDVTQTFEMDLPGGPRDFSEFLTDVGNDVRSFMLSVALDQATRFRWTSVKVAPIERGTGKYLAPSTIMTLKAPVPGIASAMLPPECALALSMRAGIVGRRGRGRVYLPGYAATSIDSQGQAGLSNQSRLGEALRDLIKDLEDTAGVDTYTGNVVVMSAQNTTAVIPNEVRVGNHVDAQRRRQHQVEEQYYITAL